MTTWFIADTHFGRQPRDRIKASGMTSVELDDRIDTLWRERVQANDSVWHLGDIGPDMDRLVRLPGRKHLIKGNDDPSLRDLQASGHFKGVWMKLAVELDDVPLFLVHKPGDVPATVVGHVIHGHTHALDPKPGHRSVSVDRTDWGPITFEELMARNC